MSDFRSKLLELIKNEIGFEWGDTIKFDGLPFSIYPNNNVNGIDVKELIRYVIDGNYEYVWAPKVDEYYYTPSPHRSDLYWAFVWCNNDIDKERLKRGLVFKTSDEAIQAAKKMIECIGGEVE